MTGRLKVTFFCVVAAVFLAGGVNLYPCAAGAETAQESKKSCHGDGAQKKHSSNKEEKKRDKPCCSLHCYNPQLLQAHVKMAPPAIATVTIENEEVPFTSVSFSPPLPPPRPV